MVLEISQFFDFQDGRRPPSCILKFLVAHQPGSCIVVPNFNKIGQTVAELKLIDQDRLCATRSTSPDY